MRRKSTPLLSTARVAVATLAAIGLVSLAGPATAQPTLREEKEAIAAFLSEHVMVRALVVDEGEATLPKSHLNVCYKARLTFTGLAETANGFSFRETEIFRAEEHANVTSGVP